MDLKSNVSELLNVCGVICNDFELNAEKTGISDRAALNEHTVNFRYPNESGAQKHEFIHIILILVGKDYSGLKKYVLQRKKL